MSLKGRITDCLGTCSAQKKTKNSKKIMLNKLINDIDIITEAISNGDTKDAIQMLQEVQQELKIISLMS